MNSFYKPYSRTPKYHNKKTVVDGITFDSKHEAERYKELRMLQIAGEISELRLQVPYELIPLMKLNGETFRSTKYVADFVYKDKNGNEIVEDAKGMKTDVYKLKKKLMAYIHHIIIQEV
jgi:hypothetical protein